MNNVKAKCPQCDSQEYRLVNSKNLKYETLELRECSVCKGKRYRVRIVAGVEMLLK